MQIKEEGWLNLKGTPIALVTSFFCQNVYKGKGWGQIFGLFKGTYFMDRPLEQKVIKQRLRYNKIMGVKLSSAVVMELSLWTPG